MAGTGLVRTDYWNRVTGSVRTGDTRRDETVTDIEDFLLPYAQAANAGLHLWGIADGLRVTATANQAGLSLSPGTAIDAAGHLIVLSGGGLAVVDPDIDPDDIANIPTVAVDTTGLNLPTAGHTGARYLTIRYLEVSVEGLLGNAPALVHAPWLRLLDTDGFSDSGTDVVVARVSITDGGGVSALGAELRRLAGLPTERLQLRRPTTSTAAPLSVSHTPVAELRARPDGGVVLDMLGSGPPTTALSVDPAANIGIGAPEARRKLHVEGSEIHSGGGSGGFSFADRGSGSFVETPTAGERWVWYAQDGTARLRSGADRLAVAANGNIGVGINAQEAQRILHVEGTEVHSGGGVGGFSFADRTTGSFVETPTAGQRWVWYAQDGTARLRSGADRLSVAPNGNIGIGINAGQAQRTVHVEGTGIHIGGRGPIGGFSFADLNDGSFVQAPTAGERWVWYAQDGTARLWSGADHLSVAANGNIGIGISARQAQRTLHVEGHEVHSGGPIGGFSFADRTTSSFIEAPTAGQRWVWYAHGGVARLWSGADRLAVNADGSLQVRTGSGTAVTAIGQTGVSCQGGVGVVATSTSGSFAGIFNGDVRVSGTINKAAVQFEIDHPLDPATKFLHHSAIESDEMKNIYDGVADIDSEGRAEIILPDWFEALNENYRYQLTPIGAAAPDLHIAGELHNGRFTIAGGQPGTKVCWLVSGVRHDAYAKAHPLQVEALKSSEEAGLFLHPAEHDEPAERSLATLFTPPANDLEQG